MHNDTQSRVNAIREWLAQHNIDALLVPHEDEYLVNTYRLTMSAYIG